MINEVRYASLKAQRAAVSMTRLANVIAMVAPWMTMVAACFGALQLDVDSNYVLKIIFATAFCSFLHQLSLLGAEVLRRSHREFEALINRNQSFFDGDRISHVDQGGTENRLHDSTYSPDFVTYLKVEAEFHKIPWKALVETLRSYYWGGDTDHIVPTDRDQRTETNIFS